MSQQERRQDGFDFAAHLRRQREFSERTFGPGARTKGVIDHIRRELAEIEQTPDDLSEWADVVILGLDGFWRAGATPQQIIDALVAKQTKNESRQWPDWRTAKPDTAIEHVRDAAPEAERPRTPPESAAQTPCINCGEFGGYETNEGNVGAFCEQCWQFLKAEFAPAAPASVENRLNKFPTDEAWERDQLNGPGPIRKPASVGGLAADWFERVNQKFTNAKDGPPPSYQELWTDVQEGLCAVGHFLEVNRLQCSCPSYERDKVIDLRCPIHGHAKEADELAALSTPPPSAEKPRWTLEFVLEKADMLDGDGYHGTADMLRAYATTLPATETEER